MNCEHCGAPVNFLMNPIQCEYCGCSIYKLNSSDRPPYDFSDCTVLYADDTPFAVVPDHHSRNRHDDSIMALLTAVEIRQILDGRKS